MSLPSYFVVYEYWREVPAAELDAEFAKLNPPRRDYQNYWASKQADEDMNRIAGGAEAAGKTGYTKFRGVQMVDRAGHWHRRNSQRL